MKVVLDTMLWVSYCTLKDGYRHRLIEHARRKRAMARRAILRIAKVIDLQLSAESLVPGDKDDDPIVQTALVAKADYLVTADKEILKVKKVEDLEIITPHGWDELLSSQ